MFSDNSIQGVVLDTIKKEQKTACVFTINGFQMRVRILGADQYTVLVEDDEGVQSLIYKHAISTIRLPKGRKFAFDNAPNAADKGGE